MRIDLLVKFEFLASHSLCVREEPHPHLWRVEAAVTGQPVDGMIVNLPDLRTGLESCLNALKNSYLNQNSQVSEDVRRSPTCETLGTFLFGEFSALLDRQFRSGNPSLRLASVMVTLMEPDRTEWGPARVSDE